MSDSARPSDRYSESALPLLFSNGRTATDSMLFSPFELLSLRAMKKPAIQATMMRTATIPNSNPLLDRDLVSAFVGGAEAAATTVVGPVVRLTLTSVLCGRRLVS